MKKNTARRVIALGLCAVLCLCLVFACGIFPHHECEGEGCAVCALMLSLRDLFAVLALGTAAFSLFFSAKSATRVCLFILPGRKTPVGERVRMND